MNKIYHQQSMGCGGSKVQATASNNLFCMSCIDGRATDEMMGSPGGDAGNVFRSIYATSNIFPDIVFDQKKMEEIILLCAKKFGHQLYYHTDDHAILHYNPKNDDHYDEAIKAENIGCGYFKLCVTAPDKLEESEKCVELAKTFLKALSEDVHDNSNKFDVVCLHGEHHELHVVISKIVKPLKADGETFIYHPKMELLEGQKIISTIGELELIILTKKDEIVEEYRQICKKHWSHVIVVLAPGVEIEKIKE
ncbi:hypothetical protein TRFO_32401 [Tritrichomonas foetus]|uniref:Uncharacterized protein n=1 Tax=Tritrichomonas foetus TaxID=1144522 RepID=A0A1J4JQZ8_9EUKA|nr:hypothetical protein TRFO_32401 [Tritrichomonas foetus]|eukprot:OHT00840.1 hypothetical protein TRFO_32401 [Tritrichomonas foetus]